MDVLSTPTFAASGPESRPAIAIISNSQTPYRLHLHRRIAVEIPQVKLWSLFTHETSNATWEFSAPQEIGPVLFGKGERSQDQDKLAKIVTEWRRGGRIIHWLKERDVRFVVMMGYNDAGRIRIIRWCRRQAIPCFLFGDSNIEGDTARGFKAWLKKIIVGWVVRSCTGILTCGSLGQAYFAKYGARRDRMFFFPYEPDYQLIQQLPEQTIELARKKFGLPPQRRRIVYSGRLIEIKRVDLLIDAFIAIAPERPEWDLVIAGDGPLRQSLSARVPVALSKRILWAGFIDDQAMLSAIYRASDVLVLPSDYEPWALVINEAAAANLAIVSSSVVGAAAELVQDRMNGRIFPSGDLTVLTECLFDVTDASRTDQMKAESAKMLQAWRARGDPVRGLQQAMQLAGIGKLLQSETVLNPARA
jgi:glycosyltransferase involved in cell wall biosynthesis